MHWFLSPAKDTRSSLYLEDVGTEFQVQGLELDWTKSHVGRRLALVGRRLDLSQFSRGEVDGREEARPAKDLKNAYRVLLARARQGVVIFVPPGAKRDKTRSPGFYEGVSQYLADLGIRRFRWGGKSNGDSYAWTDDCRRYIPFRKRG